MARTLRYKTGMSTIAVYCGSSSGARPGYFDAANLMGRRIAESGHALVYGGGDVGLMGAVANAALAAGGEVVGVITQYLADKELSHPGLTELVVVGTMHERKQEMAERADAFIALPGGVGTLEEIIEVFVWTQLGLQQKPCGFLNVAGFYSKLIEFLESMISESFMKKEHLEALLVSEDVDDLLKLLTSAEPSYHAKWQD